MNEIKRACIFWIRHTGCYILVRYKEALVFGYRCSASCNMTTGDEGSMYILCLIELFYTL